MQNGLELARIASSTIFTLVNRVERDFVMTQTPIRVGIAGLGRSGWDIHAHLLAPLNAQFQVVAVVDADPARRAEAVDRFDCQAYEA